MTPCLKAALAAAAASLATAASAQSLQLYGLVDLSAGEFQNAGAPKLAKVESGGLTTSFVGVKGTEDLGGGLKVKFALEHFLQADTGVAGRFTGDAFWARNAYVGLQGAFGTTTLGRNTTPLFISTLAFNALGDSFSFSPSIRQLFTPSLLPFFADTNWDNSLAYTSVDHHGLSWRLMGNLGEGAPGATGKNLGAHLLYFSGPLAATAAWQRVKNGAFGTPPGWKEQDTFQLGASYELKAVKLFTQYTQVKTEADIGTRTTLYGFGAWVALSPSGKLVAQYGHARASASGLERINRTTTFGYDHDLSKSTDLYALVMNDRVTGLNSGNTLAAGVRLRF